MAAPDFYEHIKVRGFLSRPWPLEKKVDCHKELLIISIVF